MTRGKTLKTLERECSEWNAKYTVGQRVKYHPEIGGQEFYLHSTRTEAQVLSGHTAVVWLTGKAGCVCLEACEAVI